MKTHCIPSKDLQDLAVLTWVSADTAVAASVKDNCLYEIVMPPNLQNVKCTKISQPYTDAILALESLPPGCGAGPSAAGNAATS